MKVLWYFREKSSKTRNTLRTKTSVVVGVIHVEIIEAETLDQLNIWKHNKTSSNLVFQMNDEL
jgi:hypothetical protein